jgi:integrase
VKLTQRTVNTVALPPGRTDVVYFDDALPGFGIRIRDSGLRMYVIQYKLGAKHRRMTLGPVNALRLEAARTSAAELLAAVRLGRDPAGEKASARMRTFDTLGAAGHAFLTRQKARLRPRSYAASERYLLDSFRPLHSLPLAGITRRDIAQRLAELAVSSGPSAADRARATLSALFGWAMREGLTDTNPVLATNRQATGRGRERVLSDSELADVWRHAGDGAYGTVVKLLILTGQRREEIGALQWAEIDLAAGLIRLPAGRTKNGRAHDVPLSAPAVDLLQALPRTGPAVFGTRAAGFAGYSIPKRALDRRIAETRQAARREPTPPWVLHDLRRSVATHMAELGVQPHIIEAVLNHVSGHKAGVAGVYNRATYEREKRQALDLWAEHVMALVERRATNVVPLRA